MSYSHKIIKTLDGTTEKLRRKPQYEEDQLQMACIAWFNVQHHSLSPYLHHSPNGGRRSKVEGAIFKAMGTKAGFPDLLFFYPNRYYPFLGVELKVGKNKQLPSQIAMQELFENAGAKYVVVRTLDEFMRLMNDYVSSI